MSDFDVESLATYLHLTPAQVLRMAGRDQLPGRRISGQWRFAAAEVHHWLEERIGASDVDELQEVEQVLERHVRQAEEPICIADMLKPPAVAVPLRARTRTSVITAMCELAAATGLLWDAQKMANSVRAREQLHPTALDIGVALLHPRRPQSAILSEAVLALGRTHQGIPFGGSDLTDVFFLVCSTSDREHLRVLARLSRLIAAAGFLDQIRAAEDSVQVLDVICQHESVL